MSHKEPDYSDKFLGLCSFRHDEPAVIVLYGDVTVRLCEEHLNKLPKGINLKRRGKYVRAKRK